MQRINVGGAPTAKQCSADDRSSLKKCRPTVVAALSATNVTHSCCCSSCCYSVAFKYYIGALFWGRKARRLLFPGNLRRPVCVAVAASACTTRSALKSLHLFIAYPKLKPENNFTGSILGRLFRGHSKAFTPPDAAHSSFCLFPFSTPPLEKYRNRRKQAQSLAQLPSASSAVLSQALEIKSTLRCCSCCSGGVNLGAPALSLLLQPAIYRNGFCRGLGRGGRGDRRGL